MEKISVPKVIAQNTDLFQMRLKNESEISQLMRKYKIVAFSQKEYIRKFWQLGLIHADLVESDVELKRVGLIKISGDTEKPYLYADNRKFRLRKKGLSFSSRKLPDEVRLYFHPFRYYQFWKIERLFKLNINPIQILYPLEYCDELVDKSLNRIRNYMTSQNFKTNIIRWNYEVELTILLEPCVYKTIFGILRYSGFSTVEEQRKNIKKHWKVVKNVINSIDTKELTDLRHQLCFDAEIIDENKEVHNILRLTKGEFRLKLRSSLEGSVLLLTMSEVIRRALEKIYKKDYPEEDEIGFGYMPKGTKKTLYGSDRIFDGKRGISREYIEKFGLDFSVKVRWYVEGETEFGALDYAIGQYNAIELINLKGEFAQKGGRGLSFKESLRNDLKSHIFSFIMIDGDNSDYVRLLKKAVEKNDICGLIFISNPDFELENFKIEELIDIIWDMIKENFNNEELKKEFSRRVESISSAKELMKCAKEIFMDDKKISKGYEWGELLMKYSIKNPYIDLASEKRRTIIKALNSAIKSVKVSWQYTRENYIIDPVNFELSKKQNRK